MTRPVNTDSPEYLLGVRLANMLLDLPPDGRNFDDWLAFGQEMVNRTHELEDTHGYHYARGFTDELRDFADLRGS